jgi:hypothetical protein
MLEKQGAALNMLLNRATLNMLLNRAALNMLLNRALIFLQVEKHIKVYTRQGFSGIPSAWKKHNIHFA